MIKINCKYIIVFISIILSILVSIPNFTYASEEKTTEDILRIYK